MILRKHGSKTREQRRMKYLMWSKENIYLPTKNFVLYQIILQKLRRENERKCLVTTLLTMG
jgi:hypothetical protein